MLRRPHDPDAVRRSFPDSLQRATDPASTPPNDVRGACRRISTASSPTALPMPRRPTTSMIDRSGSSGARPADNRVEEHFFPKSPPPGSSTRVGRTLRQCALDPKKRGPGGAPNAANTAGVHVSDGGAAADGRISGSRVATSRQGRCRLRRADRTNVYRDPGGRFRRSVRAASGFPHTPRRSPGRNPPHAPPGTP